jgi:glutathione S-transferase
MKTPRRFLHGGGMHSVPKTLFDFPFSGNGYKIRLALTQLGLPFEYRIIDLLAGQGQSADYLALTPMGQVPALQLADGTVLWESNAILFWLTEGTHLMPPDKLGRTRVVQWMNFEQSSIDKVLGRTRFLKRYPDFMETRQSDWDGWYAAGHRALRILESQLAQNSYLVENKYSAADICLYGYVHSADEGGFDLNQYPAVMGWMERVRSQPGHLPITAHG